MLESIDATQRTFVQFNVDELVPVPSWKKRFAKSVSFEVVVIKAVVNGSGIIKQLIEIHNQKLKIVNVIIPSIARCQVRSN